MEDARLKELVAKIADFALENKEFMGLYYGVNNVLSYLKSEQDKRKELKDKLDETIIAVKKLEERMDKEERSSTVIEQKMQSMSDKMDRGTKLQMSILTAVLTALAIQVLKVVFK